MHLKLKTFLIIKDLKRNAGENIILVPIYTYWNAGLTDIHCIGQKYSKTFHQKMIFVCYNRTF